MSYVKLGTLSAGEKFLFKDWEDEPGVYEVEAVFEDTVYAFPTLGGPTEAYNSGESVCVFLSGKNDFPNCAGT